MDETNADVPSNAVHDDDASDAALENAELRPRQPTGTPVKLARFDDGLTIEVPPGGLWKGSCGLFPFAILWNLIVGIITTAIIAAFLGSGQKQDQGLLFPIAILSVFDLVGVALLLASVNMGRRRAAIPNTGGTLMVIQTSMFGAKQRQWPAGEIEDVVAGPSGMEVNNVPVLELQILSTGNQKFGLLAGRSNDELRWLVAELRGTLGLS
jgi:hypothetical protein